VGEETTPGEVTSLLIELGEGKQGALDRLLPLVYDELHVLARFQRYRWRGPDTPSTTSLLHDAFLKLVDQTRIEWQNRRQFFYLASLAMRHVLVDNARRNHRRKRGGGHPHVPVDDVVLVSEERGGELLALDEALTKLKQEDERLGQIVECRFFGGLTIEETGEALGISPATVKRGWTLARSLLYRTLRSGSEPGED
jgi:RNA polymerase sigma factor (TIGR02999 family)